jgi:hypothetical protein
MRYDSMLKDHNEILDEYQLSFPKLMKKKYENFYEDLYRLNGQDKITDKM